MPPEQMRNIGRHRAIEVYRNRARYGPCRFELGYVIEDSLNAADRERRDDNHPTTCKGAVKYSAELDQWISLRVQPVAIRRFDHQVVGLFDRRGSPHDWII